jgi:hypothetical protein
MKHEKGHVMETINISYDEKWEIKELAEKLGVDTSDNCHCHAVLRPSGTTGHTHDGHETVSHDKWFVGLLEKLCGLEERVKAIERVMEKQSSTDV